MFKPRKCTILRKLLAHFEFTGSKMSQKHCKRAVFTIVLSPLFWELRRLVMDFGGGMLSYSWLT